MKKIFIIGIGGKGLNGIAKICLEKGYQVSGVDTQRKDETISLEKNGAKIFYEHSEKNIKPDIDLIIYSSLAKNSPEISAGQRYGIKIMKRSAFLDKITKDTFRISVAGSHGKSTTTALLGLSCINAGLDATIYGGAYTKEFNGYNHFGKANYSIIEACEYDRSFYDLVGNMTIITSLEKSHLEYYKTENKMNKAFEYFLNKHDEFSKVFINGDDLKLKRICRGIKGRLITFGFGIQNDYIVSEVRKEENESIFSIYHKGQKIIDKLKIKIPGDYNILNFVSVVAVMNELNLNIKLVHKVAENFYGVGRRFEISKNKTGQILIDDFAHHPTQVKYLFDGIRQFYPKSKVLAIFQPRQFNIMKNFTNEYGESFKQADEIIMTDIIPTLMDTPEDIKSISSQKLMETIALKSNKPIRLINTFPEIIAYARNHYQKNDIITTIGAGDIYKVRDELMK